MIRFGKKKLKKDEITKKITFKIISFKKNLIKIMRTRSNK